MKTEVVKPPALRTTSPDAGSSLLLSNVNMKNFITKLTQVERTKKHSQRFFGETFETACQSTVTKCNQIMAPFDFIQVKPSSKLDPCLSQIAEVAIKLQNFVIGKGNRLDEYLKRGNISQAATLARSVLKSSNEKTDCGRTLDNDTKTLVRAMISETKL